MNGDDRVRAARSDEARELSELAFRSKAHWGYGNDFMEACREELSVTRSDVQHRPTFVLERGGRLAGFYTLVALSTTEAELGHLFVEPSDIRSGVGRKLLRHAMREAFARGFRWLTIQGDPNAAGFYTACGAEPTGQRASDSIPGRVLPLFRLDVTEPIEERARSLEGTIDDR